MLGIPSPEVRTLDKRQRTTAVVAAFLGGVMLLEGVAKLFSWEPFVDTFAIWGLPTWLLPIVGALQIVAGVMLLMERAPVVVGALIAIVQFVGVALYLRDANYGLSLIPLSMALLGVAVALLGARRGAVVRSVQREHVVGERRATA